MWTRHRIGSVVVLRITYSCIDACIDRLLEFWGDRKGRRHDPGEVTTVTNDHTPPRSVRIPDDLWDKAKAEADRRGETVTDAIVRSLKRYVRPSQ